MAQTPTDPTKAQVWITKGIDELDFEFYFPQGPKGEPGGFTAATDLLSSNLDDIKTAGLYRQPNPATASLLLNYPCVASGALEVLQGQAATEYLQRYTPYSGSPAIGRVVYIRRFSGGVWSAWTVFMSSRVDQTAGRAVYLWDHINNREQLIWGDTGLRSLEAEVLNGWTASIFKIRRIGYEVTLHVYNVNPAAQTNTNMWTIPVGFRPIGAVTNQGFWAQGGGPLVTTASTVLPATNSSSATGFVHIMKYTTADTWPTTLPGTASGAIPNV